jgi:hypothetical protein
MKRITSAVLFTAISLAPVFAGQTSTASKHTSSSPGQAQNQTTTKKHRKHHSKKSVTPSTVPETTKK